MKRLYWFASLGLFAAIFLVEYDLSRRMNLRPERATAPIAENTSGFVEEQIVTASDDSSFFESATLKEAQKLARLNNNPKTLDQKMDRLAHALSPLEIRKLAIIIRNKEEPEERRAMAIELLSRSKTPDAVQMLNDFVVARQTNATPVANRTREFESILRAQAIEGIAAYPKKETALSYLDSLAKEVDESFLKDRIARSEEGLRGRAQNTQQKKDEAVLKQLVQ